MPDVPDVTLYWRPMCGYCETLKRALEHEGVAYAAVDIWEDRRQAEVVKAANGGDELVPTVRVGGRFLSNPSVGQVLDELDAAA